MKKILLKILSSTYLAFTAMTVVTVFSITYGAGCFGAID
jgi:hypothetical protein